MWVGEMVHIQKQKCIFVAWNNTQIRLLKGTEGKANK